MSSFAPQVSRQAGPAAQLSWTAPALRSVRTAPRGHASGVGESAEAARQELRTTPDLPFLHDFGRITIHAAPPAIQPKLRVGAPGDAHEREADQVAEQVMRMPEPRLQPVPRPSDDGGHVEAPAAVHDVLRSPGHPLDASTRAFMEPRFGHDFSRVRVHSDAAAARSAGTVQARAYTVGPDIVFGRGEYVPAAEHGKRLLAHELTHVVQQSSPAAANPLSMPIRRKPASAAAREKGNEQTQVRPEKMDETAESRQLTGEDEQTASNKPEQTASDKPERNGNRDRAVHWWAPLGERIAQWGYGGVVEYTNINREAVGEFTGPWVRNAFTAGIFAVGTGVVTEVALKRLKLAEMAAKAAGLGIAFGLGYEGLDLRERLRYKTIETFAWYGRYRYKAGTEDILAVEYWGKGPTKKSAVSPVYYEQAIVDADGNPLFINTDEVDYVGIHLDRASTTLPLFSYGKVDPEN